MSCTKCELCRTAKTVGVRSRKFDCEEGNIDILFVGEAPGFDDDNNGIAFVGRSGRELDRIMREAKVENALLTNTVKCIPKDIGSSMFRKPKKKEIKACLPYLISEIDTIRPKVIVPLGNTALGALTGSYKGIKSKCGSVYSFSRDYLESLSGIDLDDEYYEQVRIVPCIHPSAVIGGSADRGLCVSALATAMTVVEKGDSTAANAEIIEDYSSERFYADECKDKELEYISDVVMINSLDQFDNFVKDVLSVYKDGLIDSIAFDTETSSLLAYKPESFLLCISFALFNGTSYVLPIEHIRSPFIEEGTFKMSIDSRKYIKDCLTRLFEIPVVGHNIKFDMHWVFGQFGVDNFIVKMDTMLAEHVLTSGNGTRNNLDDTISRRLGVPKYSAVIDDVLSSFPGKKAEKSYACIPRDILFKYAGCDSEVTHRLYTFLKEELKEMNMASMYEELYTDAIYTTFELESKGCLIDEKVHSELSERYPIEMEKCLEKIKSTMYYDSFIEKTGKDSINLNSSKQKEVFLYDIMSLPGIKMTDSGKNKSTAGAVILELIERLKNTKKQDEEAGIPDRFVDIKIMVLENIKRHAGISTLNSLFVKKMPILWSDKGTPNYWKELGMSDERNKDYSIHPNFKLGGTVTGRWSCSDPNLQQLTDKKIEGFDDNIKSMIISRFGDDGLIVVSDYSQLELRVLAMAAESDIWKEMFKSGVDFHKQTASVVFRKDIDDVDASTRDAAKAVNFGLIYGGGPETVSANCDLTEDEAKVVIDEYLARFPKVSEWRDQIRREGMKDLFVVTPFGRVRFIPEFTSESKSMLAHARNVAMNSPIQGTASDMNELGLLYTSNYFKEKALASCIFSVVHDSIEVDCFAKEFYNVIKYMHKAQVGDVTKRIAEFSYGVPIAIDFEMGSSWGDTLESDSYTVHEDRITLNLMGSREVFDDVERKLSKYYGFSYDEELKTLEEDKLKFQVSVIKRS